MGNSNKENVAIQRLASLFDEGIFTEIDPFAKGENGEVEVVAGYGYVNGTECYAFAQDSNINSGAVTVAQCAKILKVFSLAKKTGCGVVGIYDSNGVQLTQGFEVLNAFGEVVKAASMLSGVVPQVSVITGACLGTSALIANMADVVIASKDSDFYITAPSDITVEESAKNGTVDIMCDDVDSALNEAKKVICMLPKNNLYSAPMVDFEYSAPSVSAVDGASVEDIVNSVLDSTLSVEFKAEYGKHVITKLGTVEGSTVGIVAFNNDEICPNCAYKAEAMVKLCDAFNIPVITVANSTGLTKGKDAQMLVAATKLTTAYASATCPKISLITGQAIGASYIILAGKGANADITLAWQNAVASPLDVEAAVAFLYNDRLADGEDRAKLEAEYKETVGSAFTAAACGAVDDVFPAEETRTKIASYLDMLMSKRETTIPRKHSVK
ncbi:carboxyl transferase domain-containing protein [Eubacterium sp.]